MGSYIPFLWDSDLSFNVEWNRRSMKQINEVLNEAISQALEQQQLATEQVPCYPTISHHIELLDFAGGYAVMAMAISYNVIAVYFYGIIHSINGGDLVLITGKGP